MPTPIVNTTGKDDADYQQRVRDAVVQQLTKRPTGKGYYASVVKKEEDSEEG